ncbi:MAG: winged helix-turn-helix domain-containing protein [Anaerolineae bacterium]
MDNPFYHRGAIREPEKFYGRDSTTTQILGLLRNGQSVSLTGPRRIGKSSLLFNLCQDSIRASHQLDAPNAVFILIDCQMIGGAPAEEVYEVLLDEIGMAVERAGIKIDAKAPSGTWRALDRMLGAVSRQGVPVVFLLDEFELLAANENLTPYFFTRLRGLTTRYGIAFVTASQRPLFAITASEEILSSPFFNIFVSLSLGLLDDDDDAAGLLEDRLAGTGITFSDELTNYLIHLVGPHPFFLHIAGYHAWQMILEAEKDDDKVESGREFGENFVLLDRAIERESDSHLGYVWQNLTADEQYALVVGEGASDVIRSLDQQCLIREKGRGTASLRPTFSNDILRRYVRRQQVEHVIQADPFVIDLNRHRVTVKGKELTLTISQFDLLCRLARTPGQVVDADNLEQAVWGEALLDDPDRLKTLIKRLRKAIEPWQGWIVSERGVGYVLREPAD